MVKKALKERVSELALLKAKVSKIENVLSNLDEFRSTVRNTVVDDAEILALVDKALVDLSASLTELKTGSAIQVADAEDAKL